MSERPGNDVLPGSPGKDRQRLLSGVEDRESLLGDALAHAELTLRELAEIGCIFALNFSLLGAPCVAVRALRIKPLPSESCRAG